MGECVIDYHTVVKNNFYSKYLNLPCKILITLFYLGKKFVFIFDLL